MRRQRKSLRAAAPTQPPTPAPSAAAKDREGDPDLDALDASLTEARVIPKGRYAYIVHPLMDGTPRVDPALLRAWVRWAGQQEAVRRATLILAPEAMGPVLASPVAMVLGIPYAIARKRSSGAPDEIRVASRTGYGSSTLHVSGIQPGDRVCVVDDVLSTGGTLDALLQALRGRCTLTGAAVFLDKGAARAALAARHAVPVVAMRSADVTVNGVKLRD